MRFRGWLAPRRGRLCLMMMSLVMCAPCVTRDAACFAHEVLRDAARSAVPDDGTPVTPEGDAPAATAPTPPEKNSPATAAPATPKPARQRPWHIVLEGDLDCTKLARDFRALLASAQEKGATLVVLELSGDGARADVLRDMAESLAACKAPTVAFLHDARERRVGAGQFALALAAGRVWIAAKARIESGADLHELLPDDTESGVAARDAAASLRPAFIARGLPDRLALDLLDPVDELRAHRSDTAIVLTNDPDDGGIVLSRRGPDGKLAITITETDARNIGLVEANAGSLNSVLTACGVRGVSPVRHVLASRLAAARESVENRLAEVARLGLECDRLLDLPDPPAADVSPQKYRESAREAIAVLDRAAGEVDAVEAALKDYPELLRGPPPGKTDLGATRARLAAMWRSELDGARKKLAAWRAKAERMGRDGGTVRR